MNYRVSPFTGLDQLSKELNSFFDDRPLVANQLDASSWKPHVDVSETEEGFKVVADIPGVDPNNIEINLHNGVLTIKGERESNEEVTEENFTRRERFKGNFVRQFTLPESIDEEAISAKSDHGVLELKIPKAKKTQPRVIQIN